MRPYEVMVIFDASLEDDAVRALVDGFTKQLETGGAKALRSDFWGKRRLAYPIKHRNEGYYAVLEVNAEPPTIADLDRQLKLADEVIRHKVIRLPRHLKDRSRATTAASPPAGEVAPRAATPVANTSNTNGA
jgi:small subunit ribosomal protein S6